MAVDTQRQAGGVVTRRSGVSRWSAETKQAFKTTEFWAMVGVIVGILVVSWAIDGGDQNGDSFPAQRAWLYVAIVASAYIVSRGLAKAGSYEPRDSDDGRPERDGN